MGRQEIIIALILLFIFFLLARFIVSLIVPKEQRNANTKVITTILGLILFAITLFFGYVNFRNIDKSDSPVSHSDHSNSTNELTHPEKIKSNSTIGSDCNCSDLDANALAIQIVNTYTQSQNQLESQYAKVMKIESIEKRDNGTWVATFKISWPFGNTDGVHPDTYINKRFACDGKEIYTL